MITIVFAFITRSLFIKYIGMELLGMNSTFTSVLNALSLSELGFESAVVYSLYRPVHDNDIEKINDIINILKVIYRCIGCVFFLGVCIVLPLLKYILVEVNLSMREICFYFVLQASASICSYFLSYKRTLLYANQKEYISKMIDMAVSSSLNVMQCIAIIRFRNYGVYLVFKLLQVLISNALIHNYCARYYSYLHKGNINRPLLKEIARNVKSIFVGRIAGLIYSSTDSIVISAFVNTVSVGYLGNYTIIVSNLRNLTNGLLTPIAPIVGNYLVDEATDAKRERVFLLYTHVRFWIALLLVCPLIVLMDSFIKLWLGPEYILTPAITYLLAADLYIHLVHSASVDYINGMGLFKMEKYIGLLGAFSNLTFSILLVKGMGVAGVLVGTILSQSIFWLGRSAIVYFKGLKLNRECYMKYWMRNLYYFFVFSVCLYLCNALYSVIGEKVNVGTFFLGGVLCEVSAVAVGLVMLWGIKEQKELLGILKNIVRKKK